MASAPSNLMNQSITGILSGLGINKPSPTQQKIVSSWIQSEGGLVNNTNNPLNTSRRGVGALGGINSSNVQRFGDLNQGIAADVATIQQPNMSDLAQAIRAGNPSQFSTALSKDPWGTSSSLFSQVYGTGAVPAVPPPNPSMGFGNDQITSGSTFGPRQQKALNNTVFSILDNAAKGRSVFTMDQLEKKFGNFANEPPTQETLNGNVTSPPTTTGKEKIATDAAINELGIPYSWGGGGPGGPGFGIHQGAKIYGFDCSSLMQYAWGKAGVKLPRTTYDQIKFGQAVPSLAQAQPGDLLFPSDHHVMMYLGNGMAIESPHTGAYVQFDNVSSQPFVAIRRPG